MKIKSVYGLLILGGIVLMGIVGLKLSPMIDVDQEITCSVSDIDQIQIDIAATSLHVYRIDDGEDIRFHLHGEAVQDVELIAKVDQETADVYIDFKDQVPGPTRLYLDVYLPTDYEKDLDIQITTGSVKLESMTLTDFSLNTASGSLRAEHLTAQDVNIHTTTGSIHFDTLTADQLTLKGSSAGVSFGVCDVSSAQIETTSGSIRISEGFGDFDLQARSGSVRLTMPVLQENDVRLKTSSGSIILSLPEDAEFSLQAENTSGSIESDFPITFLKEHQVDGEIGDATSTLQINATTGSISIRKR